MKFEIKKIVDIPTSTYHTAKYGEDNFFIAGSNWNRKSVQKGNEPLFSAQGRLYHYGAGKVVSFPTDTDMLYIVEVISKDLLFLGAKTEKNTFQLFSLSQKKVIKQQSDPQGGGCYGTLYLPENQELLMATRNGFLQTVDIASLKVKKSVQITPSGVRLWGIYYDTSEGNIYTGDYLGTLYKIRKDGFTIEKKVCLYDLYKHYDNHDNPPSLWGLSYQNGKIIGGDRFGGITIWDKDLHQQDHYRLKKDGTLILDPLQKIPSCEVESVMSLKMVDDQHFLLGSRWGNVFLGDTQRTLQKILTVPMGIQKENSAFTMERLDHNDGIEILITFGDGQVYALTSVSEE
ncbi:MAG: hypothetical protein LBO09_06390 [Candidatus Peribacteria bacterium]|jgi:hypothetical protein|nr:hypothetical protein [Candidatus Peribacteria bacterium]